MEKEVEIPHRTKSRIRIVKKRERRALERDDLDARAAESPNRLEKRFLKTARAGAAHGQFFEKEIRKSSRQSRRVPQASRHGCQPLRGDRKRGELL